jgi:hypothetical protein
MRRSVAEKFLPYEEDIPVWKTRADDILVWGSDIAGAVKYTLFSPAVKYRIHGNNLFFGKKKDTPERIQIRKEAAERFCSRVMKRNSLTMADLLHIEMQKGKSTFKSKLLSCIKIFKSRMISLPEFLKCFAILLSGKKN